MVTIQLEVNDIEYALEHVKGKVIKEKIEVEIIKEEIPDIVEKLVTAGVRVYQVTIKSKSLEEEFLALTEGAAV
jgi:ABC-2 type transport system ATP-binding protein